MVGSTETLTVCEPGRLEEDVMMGKMVIGVNAYREVCTLHLAGQVDIFWGAIVHKKNSDRDLAGLNAVDAVNNECTL